MAPDGALSIEVVYARADAQDVVALRVRPGTTVTEAIALSGILSRHPELDVSTVRVGIHGRTVPLDTAVAEGDRVEIYRPLLADPKLARRRRAARAT